MIDEDKSVAELFQDIKAVEAANWDNPTRAIPPLAALLVRLSREASETADKNILIQKRMTSLTRWILLLTVCILVVSAAQLAKMFMEPQAATTAPKAAMQQSDPAPQKRGGEQR